MNRPKHITVRFYTDSFKYMGWQYLKNSTYKELYRWCLSGNFLKMDNNIIGALDIDKLVFNKHYFNLLKW